MKRQSIFIVLLLLQILFICSGCGTSEPLSGVPAADAPKAVETEEAAIEEAAMEEAAPAEASLMDEKEEAAIEEAAHAENVEDAVGIFEGLEDNHTAIFSFDGAETAFYFEEPAVQKVLFEAVSGSTYTLSYHYDDSFGYVIYQISE